MIKTTMSTTTIHLDKSVPEGLMLAKKTPALAATVFLSATLSASLTAATQTARQTVIQEIVVTATKRAASINDVPASIAALSDDDLTHIGASGLEDYYRIIPGLSFVDRGPGRNNVIIRGITNDSYGDEQTSAMYFDEVALSEGGYGDLHTFDIERVEVLRGPQGTLFGAGSLGGAVRIISKKADTQSFQAALDLSFEQTERATSDLTSRINTMVNVPVIDDTLALRLVAYSENVAGIYTNTVRGEDNVGATNLDGGRIALRWDVSEQLSIDAMYASQNDRANAQQVASSIAVAAEYEQHVGGNESLSDDIDVSSVTASYDLAFATLTSATAYVKRESLDTRDFSDQLYYLYDAANDQWTDLDDNVLSKEDVIPVISPGYDRSHQFSQELRLSSAADDVFFYTVGVFYNTYSSSTGFQDFYDPLTPAQAQAVIGEGVLFEEAGTFKYKQKAVFGEFSYAINDAITMILGLRWFDMQSQSVDVLGKKDPDTPRSEFQFEYKESGTNPKLTMEWALNSDTLLYATYSQGFRRGSPPGRANLSAAEVSAIRTALGNGHGPGSYTPEDMPVIRSIAQNNQTCGLKYPNQTPSIVNSDTLDNYELGGKFSLLEQRLQVNTALYHVKWQEASVVQDLSCGNELRGSGEDIDVTGLEVEMQAQLTQSLLFTMSAGYVDSELQGSVNLLPEGNTATLDGSAEQPLGHKGDRTPGVSRYSFAASLDYSYTLFEQIDGYVFANYSFLSSRYTRYKQTPGERAGGFALADISLGLIYGNWDLSLFVKNMTNVQKVEYVDVLYSGQGNGIYMTRPRTVGINIHYAF